MRAAANDVRNYASDVLSVLRGLKDYRNGRQISTQSRRSALDLFCRTNGRFTDRMAAMLRMMRPPRRPAPVTGLLGNFSVEEQKRIASIIARDGFYVFDNTLPSAVCDEIEEFARRTPAILEGRSAAPEARIKFHPSSIPQSKKYYFEEAELAANAGIQQLMGDPAILAIAESYLGTLPKLSDVTLWWSAVHEGADGFDAGQSYHFDFDTPPKWLMIFIYLTDVGSENGPHMYVRGSHRSGIQAARGMRARGYVRLNDGEIEAAYGLDNIVELHGKRGTVLAVDTIGFHKGKPLTSGHRLMGQLIYSFPQFTGAHRHKVSLGLDVHPSLSQALAAAPSVYQKYR